MADATNGYILQQQIYTGKTLEQTNPEVGLGTRVVLDLTQGYDHKGYIVVTENFYTSPILAQELQNRGIECLGTVKGNTRGFPKELAFPQKPKPARGSRSWRNCGRILAVSWFENKAIYFLSTVHQPTHHADAPQENREVRRRSKEGTIQVSCPPLLKDYNKYMCGIDRADQNNRYYSSGRNCKRWPIRIAFHQLETSINNSYLIYRASSPLNRLTSREYRMTLATQLMSSFSREVPTVHRQRAQAEVVSRLQNVGSHMPLIGPPRVCALCSHVYSAQHKAAQRANEGPAKRPRPPHSTVICEQCNVHLYLNSNSNCWLFWHTKSNI